MACFTQSLIQILMRLIPDSKGKRKGPKGCENVFGRYLS